MSFSHILITRPREEAKELAELLAPSDVGVVVLPAYDFYSVPLFDDQVTQMNDATAGENRPLLIFTSPRSVLYGLGQIPAETLHRCEVATIGPSTARLLQEKGVRVTIRPEKGYRSEDLLETLEASSLTAGGPAFILAAPGGRTVLNEGLEQQGYEPHMLMVYKRRPATLDETAILAIEQAPALLSVWTSVNTMNAMHQRLPSRCWYRLCQGEWLVISERLLRVARAFSPTRIHLANGPANSDILTTIQSLA